MHGAGLIHRDLKPDNVILRGNDAPVLIDFGIALLAGERHQPGTGTPAYMAPEQARGQRIDARADLYALGVMAHEMLTGARPAPPRSALPFTGFAELRAIRRSLTAAGIAPDVAELVSRLLAPRPRLRPRCRRRSRHGIREGGRVEPRLGICAIGRLGGRGYGNIADPVAQVARDPVRGRHHAGNAAQWRGEAP